jgi:ABC-2 type transport system ATP-binding protein/lipopolysaccharide transport system ATP-binding protein
METTITINDVSLAYRLDRDRVGSFKEYGIRLLKRQSGHEQFLALEGVSLEVKRGEVFGVVGPNGAGKSTLMKIIARVLPPTTGRVIVRGLVAPLIALGAGFNPELTARENIILHGAILGRDPSFMEERVGPIARWADIEDFLDVPTRNYSSGMMARLAFSVATDVEPDVLVVDEILAVGDTAFKKKSKDRIRAMIDTGTSVVLVSHALPTVRRMANRVLWLDKGRVKMLGDPDEVIDAYEAAS